MNKNNFISIISPNQLEINIPYLSKRSTKKIVYDTNIYFFTPKSLNINKDNYTSNNFYSDYISYIRLIMPQKSLGILEKKILTLLSKLDMKLDNKTTEQSFTKELKLIVCSYTLFLSKYSKDLENRDINIKRLHTILKRVRNIDILIAEMLEKARIEQDINIINLLLSTIEYLNYMVQIHLLEINVYLKTNKNKYEETINFIVDIINDIITSSKDKSFPIISDDTYQNEKVIYRHSILKKYFFSTLHLYQKKEKDGEGKKEIYYAIAAGISMIFTTIYNVPICQYQIQFSTYSTHLSYLQ